MLHEVIQEVRVTILIARLVHVVLGMQVVVHVILLPLELCSLFRYSSVFFLLQIKVSIR